MVDNNSKPKATITNNSGIDVEIFDVYNTSGDPNGKLTYTSLGKIKAGQAQDIQTIHFASQLQAMYTGAVSALNNKFYYQFPVAVFGISKLSKATTYTISEDDKTGMEQAFQFIKYSTANADSKLAQDFRTALADKDQKTKVDAFFAQTGSFNKCNLVKWTAVTSWQSQFTSAWQGPYYLYNVPQTKDGSDIKLIAVVNITSTATDNKAIISIANANGEVSAQSQAVALDMAGNSVLSEAKVGAGDLTVNLQPVWINVVQTNSDSTMNYLIGSVLSGTVNGIKVIGTQQSRDLPASKNKGKTEKDKLKEASEWSKIISGLLSPFSSVAGLVISAGMLYYMAKGHNEAKTQKMNDAENKASKDSTVTQDQVKQEQQKIEEQYKDSVPTELQAEVQAKEADIGKLKAANSDVVKAQKQAVLENTVDSQVEQLEEVLETEAPTDALENTAKKLADIQTNIENGGDLDVTESDLAQVKQDVEAELTKRGNEMQAYERDALQEAQDAMDRQAEQSKELAEAQAEKKTELEKEPSEELSEDTFEEPETDPVKFEPMEVGGL